MKLGNLNGAVLVAQYDYDAWGNCILATDNYGSGIDIANGFVNILPILSLLTDVCIIVGNILSYNQKSNKND